MEAAFEIISDTVREYNEVDGTPWGYRVSYDIVQYLPGTHIIYRITLKKLHTALEISHYEFIFPESHYTYSIQKAIANLVHEMSSED